MVIAGTECCGTVGPYLDSETDRLVFNLVLDTQLAIFLSDHRVELGEAASSRSENGLMTVEERFIRDFRRQHKHLVPCERRVARLMEGEHPRGRTARRGPCAIALSLEIEAEAHTCQPGRIWSWQRVGGVTGWQDTLQIFDRNHGCYAQPSRREEAPRRIGEHR